MYYIKFVRQPTLIVCYQYYKTVGLSTVARVPDIEALIIAFCKASVGC